jgi:hypothetical protein
MAAALLYGAVFDTIMRFRFINLNISIYYVYRL